MRRTTCKVLFGVVLGVVLALGSLVAGAQTPQKGGVLKVAIAGDPPSLDMHQEQTFKVTIPMSTIYNSLAVFDPHGFPKIIGDLAQSWENSEDGMRWTFKLHDGVKFHDDDVLTSADVKASWDRIVAPPKSVASPRRSLYQMIESIEAPDPNTVVFNLKYASASFLSMIAHPANFHLRQEILGSRPALAQKEHQWHRAF